VCRSLAISGLLCLNAVRWLGALFIWKLNLFVLISIALTDALRYIFFTQRNSELINYDAVPTTDGSGRFSLKKGFRFLLWIRNMQLCNILPMLYLVTVVNIGFANFLHNCFLKLQTYIFVLNDKLLSSSLSYSLIIQLLGSHRSTVGFCSICFSS